MRDKDKIEMKASQSHFHHFTHPNAIVHTENDTDISVDIDANRNG